MVSGRAGWDCQHRASFLMPPDALPPALPAPELRPPSPASPRLGQPERRSLYLSPLPPNPSEELGLGQAEKWGHTESQGPLRYP